MFGSFKRLFSRADAARDTVPVAEWAERRGLAFRKARDAGFVIEGALEGRPWRLEWGPPKRPYIEGRELRLRAEFGLADDAQMLLLSRSLMETLERQTYEQFVGDVQTQAGSNTPEEMRWLVMFPKIDLAARPPGLDLHFGAVASQTPVGVGWVEGPLGQLLLREAREGVLRHAPPFVLMTLRGNLYLRLQLPAPDPASVAAALLIFETAATQALRVAGDVTDTSSRPRRSEAPSDWHTLQPGGAGSGEPRR